MRKRVLSLTLALALCLGLAIPAFAEGDVYDGPPPVSLVLDEYGYSYLFGYGLKMDETPVTLTSCDSEVGSNYTTLYRLLVQQPDERPFVGGMEGFCSGTLYVFATTYDAEKGTVTGYVDLLDHLELGSNEYGDTVMPTYREILDAAKNVEGNAVMFKGDGALYMLVLDTEASTEPAKPESKLVAKENVQTVKVDGKDVSFAMYSPDNGGTNYVRLVDLAVALKGTAGQYNVGYDGRVLLTAGEAYEGEASTAPFHSEMAYTMLDEPTYVNGVAQNLEGIRFEYQNGGYTYYKLRDLGEALGFNVGWDNANERIYIESDKAYDPNN